MRYDILQLDDLSKNFILENGDKGYETVVSIIDATTTGIPILSVIHKIAKVAISYLDYRFICKLSRFLRQVEGIPQSDKDKFIQGLTPKDNERISSYLIYLLYSSEEDEKASIMGMLYKARLLGNIDDDTMLRLCSVVQKCYLKDLKKLPEYVDGSGEDTLEASNFINYGIIDNFVGGVWMSEPLWKLNELGKTLHDILKQNNWF